MRISQSPGGRTQTGAPQQGRFLDLLKGRDPRARSAAGGLFDLIERNAPLVADANNSRALKVPFGAGTAAALVVCVGCANTEAQTEQYGSAQPDIQCVSVSADKLQREYKQLDGKKLCVSGELLAH